MERKRPTPEKADVSVAPQGVPFPDRSGGKRGRAESPAEAGFAEGKGRREDEAEVKSK